MYCWDLIELIERNDVLFKVLLTFFILILCIFVWISLRVTDLNLFKLEVLFILSLFYKYLILFLENNELT